MGLPKHLSGHGLPDSLPRTASLHLCPVSESTISLLHQVGEHLGWANGMYLCWGEHQPLAASLGIPFSAPGR